MKKLIGIFVFALIFWTTSFAQNPVPIEVTALTINKPNLLSGQYTISATGLPQPFSSPLVGNSNAIFYALESCSPCYLGTSFIIGGGISNQFRPNGSPESVYVRITLTGNPSTIILAPTIRLRDNPVVITSNLIDFLCLLPSQYGKHSMYLSPTIMLLLMQCYCSKKDTLLVGNEYDNT